MRETVVALGWSIALLAGCRDHGRTPAVHPEAEALEVIHQHDRLEVGLGQIAGEKALSGTLKERAGTIVHDHQDIDARVVEYAIQQRLELVPDTPAAEAREKQGIATLERMRQLRGAELDRAVAALMKTDHETVLAVVQRARERPGARFGELLGAIEPVVRRDLSLTRDLSAQVAAEAPARPPVHARRRPGRP